MIQNLPETSHGRRWGSAYCNSHVFDEIFDRRPVEISHRRYRHCSCRLRGRGLIRRCFAASRNQQDQDKQPESGNSTFQNSVIPLSVVENAAYPRLKSLDT